MFFFSQNSRSEQAFSPGKSPFTLEKTAHLYYNNKDIEDNGNLCAYGFFGSKSALDPRAFFRPANGIPATDRGFSYR
jgi:hypothetical protein